MSIPGIPYMPVFKAPLVALWRSEHCTTAILVGRCVRLAAGRLSQAPGDSEWIFKQCWAAIRKSVRDLCPFVPGLTVSGTLRPVAGSYRHTTHSHQRTKHTHMHTLSGCPILTQKCGWFPVWRHCAPHSLLPTRDADQNNKPGCSCCGTSTGLSSLITFSHFFFFFFKHSQLWKQRWWSIRSLWIVARLNWLNYISYYQIIRFLLFFYWYATHLKKHILKCAALLWCYMLSAK